MTESLMSHIYNGFKAKQAGNLKEALEYFQKALECEPGSPIAAYEVACFYEEGELVPQDFEKAFALYSQAADGCVELAQEKLCEWYSKGLHVEKNAGLAKHWRQRADEQRKKDAEPPLTLAESIRKKIAEKQNKSH